MRRKALQTESPVTDRGKDSPNVAKQKPESKGGKDNSAACEDIPSDANDGSQESGEGISVGLETPEFQRELMSFINLVASICSSLASTLGRK